MQAGKEPITVYVLYMDIVDSTRATVEQQDRINARLKEIVMATREFQDARARNELISLPTGDGMALVFLRKLEAPARCAIEIQRALLADPFCGLRMGIHSGPVLLEPDINGQPNVSGDGISLAARVMSCASGGHILLSRNAADLLRNLEAWKTKLHKLGEYQVKEDRLEVWNFVDGEIGNRTRPTLPTSSRTRLMVLPFRMLREDPEIEFLAFSLADAITNSLSGLKSLALRSSMAAARYAGPSPDFKLIAKEAEVDAVLTGTLLRSGQRLRVSAQLSAVPGGTVLWSQSSQWNSTDVFQLQDDLAQGIVQSLSLPITARESSLLKHDVPSSAAAYEYYLRANQVATDWETTRVARDLYVRSLDHDPNYAPAWARLGRCHRLIGKYGGQRDDLNQAEYAFRRALELNPDLALAHNLFATLEADRGGARDAMVKLLRRAHGNANDPDLFAGLVYVCRFCGLLNASLAAHEQARRLDPLIPTSANQTFFMAGDYERALQCSATDIGYMDALALAAMDRGDQALQLLRDREQRKHQHQLIRWFVISLRALLEGRKEEALQATEQGIALIHWGGEELYYFVRQLARAGDVERAITELERTVESGFICRPVLERDPWLDSLRSGQRFSELLRTVEFRHQEARRMFIEAGGLVVLGAE
jgi:TolB-like protein